VAGDERLDAIRKHLAVLIKRGQHVVAYEDDSPSKWWFGTIVDPRTGTYFTPSGAWEFIAEQLLDKGNQVRETQLKKPPGKKAYELRVRTQQGVIYVKIQFGEGDTVIGRSFHL